MNISQLILKCRRNLFNLVKKYFIGAIKTLILLIKLYAVVYIFGEIGLFFVADAINTGELFNIGVAAFTPLAILLAFSGLMYNRTRAIVSRSYQFRSLYIAERLFSATVSYLLALVTMFFCYLLAKKFNFVFSFESPVYQNYHSLLLLVPLSFFIAFCSSFVYAISATGYLFNGLRTVRFAIKVKRLLQR